MIIILESWKIWAQKQWDIWGKKLSPAYKNIESWQTSEWIKTGADKFWNSLDNPTKKYLYDFIMKTLKNLDEELAKKIIKNVFDILDKYFKQK